MNNSQKRSFILPAEQQAIRAKCFHPTGTFVQFDKEEIEQSIPERFEKIVSKYADRVAVKAGNDIISYQTLNRLANRVAWAVLEKCGLDPEPVALLIEKGPPQIAAMLGVLKAGKFFVLLDSSFPSTRLATVLADSQARLVLVDKQNVSLVRQITNTPTQTIILESLESFVRESNPRIPISPTSIAFICYTSGSTGQPKGVIWNHRFLLHHEMVHTNLIHVSEHDRLTLLTAGTGNTITNIFLALLTGASLFPFDAKTEGVNCLATWLRDERITICLISATLFRNLCGMMKGDQRYRDLRLIRLRSESVYSTDFDLAKKYFPPECAIATGLSSTETGILRSYCVDNRDRTAGEEAPVGYAVEDKEILLLDQGGQKVGFNEIGEIVVRSRYLSEGYWRNPYLTKSKFQPDAEGISDKRLYFTGDLGLMLPDGCLIHKGRKDFRVKIRGYGVELIEIERMLLRHPAVNKAAVTAPQSKSGDACLVAYFTSSIQPAPAVDELRNFLRENLPDYMIPSAFVELEAIPLTANGKIDRQALPDPEMTRRELNVPYAPATSKVEQRLAKIWQEVLDVRPVGIDDNFFDIGGHSLLAAKLFGRLDQEFSRLPPLSVLFSAPTVRLLAEVYDRSGRKEVSPLVPLATAGSLPPLYALPGVFGNVVGFADLSRELGPDQPFYGLQSIGLDGMNAPLESIESMAELYLSEIRKVQPHGPYAFVGSCFGARVAYEMARQLLEVKEEVAFLGLLDPSRREGYATSEGSVSVSGLSKRARLIGGFVTDRLRLYSDEIRRLNRGERIKFIANKMYSLSLKLGDSTTFNAVRREIHQREVFKANKKASKRYRRKPLSQGPRALEIFETTRNIGKKGFDWKSLCGDNPIRHHVPGKDSGDMVSGENARAFAELLARRMKAAFAKKSTGSKSQRLKENKPLETLA